MDIKETKEKIEESLHQIAADLTQEFSDKIWTKAIKERLTSLGHDRNCGVAAGGVNEAERGEWLYDLTWWKYEGNNLNNMTSISLAVESEWQPAWEEVEGESRATGYENDFLKLVYAKAKLKLFIFWANDENECDKILDRLMNFANMCEDRDGDEYLFSCALWTKEEGFTFIHKSFTAKSQ